MKPVLPIVTERYEIRNLLFHTPAIKHKFAECSLQYCLRWEDAKRAYLKFIDYEIITRYITRNPFTLGYTFSYTLLYTKTHRIYTKLQIVT